MLERAQRQLAVAVALGAASLVGACAGEGAEQADTAIGTSTGALDTAGGMTAGAMSEAEIFGFSNHVDQAEVAAGELAQQKAQNADVKRYAQMMVTEHSKHMRDAGTLAQRVNVNPTDPEMAEMKRSHEQLMTDLRNASGMAFDTLYIAAMVHDHSAALGKLNDAMNATQNTEVQQFLNETRATVQQHLERAQTIRGQLSNR